jgi:hypothetical protein
VKDGVGVYEAAQADKVTKTIVSRESFVRSLYEASSQTEFATARNNVIGSSFCV